MKILIFGAGVLGCNMARNFFRAGKDVTLLARGEWGETIRKDGLRIKDKFSPFVSVTRVPVTEELKPEDLYDVIFVVVRYTQIDGILPTLRENPTKNIVFVGNNVRARALSDSLPGKNVLFAFSLSAGRRDRERSRVASVDLKKVTIGQLPGAPTNALLVREIFDGTKFKVVYQPNMEDYLLCHAAFVMPAAFACYKTDGNLKKLKGNTAYFNRMIDANIEGYRAIKNAGHEILPEEDKEFEGDAYRKTCLRFFKLMCATSLGKICASDHAMSAVDEMSALNRDLKHFFDEHGAAYPVWQSLEAECGRYLTDAGTEKL
ncbi:MAG TPA: ketopantoate reductase family protein [Clostridiales bacterium]|nr:ketopantoate reductase family protein [Clostridiales bacterium]